MTAPDARPDAHEPVTDGHPEPRLATSRRSLLAGGLAAASAVALGRAAKAEAQAPITEVSWTLKATKTGGYVLDGSHVGPVTYSEPGKALQAALDDLAPTGGTIKIERGAYFWRSVPKIPKDIPRALRILGEGGTQIKLQPEARRFLDFKWTGNHDTFQNIEIGWLKIEANNISGNDHVILGNPYSGPYGRMNFQDIYLHDITAYELPVVQSRSGGFRSGVVIQMWQDNAREGTRNFARRIRCERVRVLGGNVAIEVVGRGPVEVSSQGGLNTFIDDVVFQDCHHDTGIVPTTGPWGASFQIGGRGYGDRARMSNCYVKGSGDTAFEVNGMRETLVDGCVAEEVRGEAFYLTNFMSPRGAGQPPDPGQRITWRDCSVIRHHGTNGHGYRTATNVNMPLGSAVIENCKYIRTTPDLTERGEVAFFNAPMTSGRINGLDIDLGYIHYKSSAEMNAWLIGTNNLGNPNWLSISNVTVRMSGARTGSANVPFRIFYLNGEGTFKIDNVDFDINLDNWGSHWVSLIEVGPKPGAKLTGSISNLDGKFREMTNTRLVMIYGQDTLVVPGRINLSNIRASGSGAREDISYYDSTNVGKVTTTNIDWVAGRGMTQLSPGGISAASSPFVYTNAGGPDEVVTVGGPDIDAIELSTNGSQYHDTGMTQGGLVLPAGASIRVRYSGSKPTILTMRL